MRLHVDAQCTAGSVAAAAMAREGSFQKRTQHCRHGNLAARARHLRGCLIAGAVGQDGTGGGESGVARRSRNIDRRSRREDDIAAAHRDGATGKDVLVDDAVAALQRHRRLDAGGEQLASARQPDAFAVQRRASVGKRDVRLHIGPTAEGDGSSRRVDGASDDRELIAGQRDRACGIGLDRAVDVEAEVGWIDVGLRIPEVSRGVEADRRRLTEGLLKQNDIIHAGERCCRRVHLPGNAQRRDHRLQDDIGGKLEFQPQ